MGSVVLRAVSAARLRAALEETGLAKAFVLHLLARVARQEQAIANMVMLNSEQRLAVVLLELARKTGVRHGAELRIEQHITHEDLAAMVGTTRSRIGLFLKVFHARGLLDLGKARYFSVNEQCVERYIAEVGGLVPERTIDADLDFASWLTASPSLVQVPRQ